MRLTQIDLERLIGVGSMARVYRAFQRGIGRNVAVKFLHPELSKDAAIVARFLREANIASKLSHPHVVQMFTSGQLPEGAGPRAGALYIVMEYLDGIALSSALAGAGGALPLARSLRIILQVCDAVGEAHALGIVHRDLKPENLMLVAGNDDADFVKVLDFGIARMEGGHSHAITRAGLIFGTARYISPEGAAGERVGPPSDVYALATILYQMLSGETPFEADSHVALLVRKTSAPARSLLSLPRGAYVPPPIADLVMRNLSKAPAERSPDAHAFGRALLDAARASGLSADDLLTPSRLAASRAPSRPLALRSVQPTRQLEAVPAPAMTDPDEKTSRTEQRRARAQAVVFIAACFLGGASLAAFGAYRWGFARASRARDLPSGSFGSDQGDPTRANTGLAAQSDAGAERRDGSDARLGGWL